VLGRYAADAPLAGSVQLDVDAARTAIAKDVAEPLGLSVEAAAAGILRIVNVLMTNAVRTISVERGRDLRDFTLVAFGGAGPAHAGEIARELSIPRVLIPPFPGCASAFGALVARSRRDFVRTVGRRTDRLDATGVARLIDEMIAGARDALSQEGVVPGEQTIQTWLDLRYVGQAHELGVLSDTERVERAAIVGAEATFHALHRQLYGHSFDDVPVELVHVRVKGLGPQPQTEMTWSWPETAEIDLASRRSVYFDEADGFVDTEIRVREDVQSGDRIVGPSIVHQVDSTVVVPHGFVAEALRGGSLVLTPVEAGRAAGHDAAHAIHKHGPLL
jgi:N-methylhydantoinase A